MCSCSGTRLVAPGDVVAGVGGQDIHLGVVRQVLGNIARVKLGAAANRLTVSLYDDRELHCSSSDPPWPELGEESGPSSPCGPESGTGVGPRSGASGARPLRRARRGAHDGGGWRAAASAPPAPAALAALTGAFRVDAGRGQGRPAGAARTSRTGRALRTDRAGGPRSAKRGRSRPNGASCSSSCGRYKTAPSSARARRSLKSTLASSDSTRILRFLTSMPSRVVSTTRL